MLKRELLAASAIFCNVCEGSWTLDGSQFEHDSNSSRMSFTSSLSKVLFWLSDLCFSKIKNGPGIDD